MAMFTEKKQALRRAVWIIADKWFGNTYYKWSIDDFVNEVIEEVKIRFPANIR